ncbi:TPA: FAD-dependent oxidoreductase, partial [Candidatus Bipolaricaulota bacterium]|nr:FAD-dependent oxidoreductase [Candidatus Bipolaricaulota bacterium]
MLEASQDPRIKLLTYAELEEAKGYVGNFEVKIRKKARFIDESKCTGCGDCAKVCPVEVPNPFDLGMALQKATYKPFPQAIPNKHVILKEGVSPCRTGCPLGVNAHGYVALIAAGRVEDALKLVLERLPFPGIMGRICTHPCQEQCNRSSVGGSIQIRALKRFVADHGKVSLGGEVPEERQERVAIVGAGPAGLMAAYELRRRGYKVTVFDALEAPGGMLRAGIPPYRLPREVIDQGVAPLEQMGVEFKLGVEVGKDLPWRELLQGRDALLVAIGAHRTVRLGLEGEDLPGVWQGLEFLKAVNLGTPPQVSGKVVIIGGGNTAIDAARTALRLGAEEVHIYYRRGREEMPASEEEIEGAEEEG